jgi:FKBP-type peptidyl-prolyl cis-trans isomerase 2
MVQAMTITLLRMQVGMKVKFEVEPEDAFGA